jgi:hypothetical protein
VTLRVKSFEKRNKQKTLSYTPPLVAYPAG